MIESPLNLAHPHLLEHHFNGGVLRTGLLSPSEFEFATGPCHSNEVLDGGDISLRGIRLRFAGQARTAPNSFELSSIEISHCESDDGGWAPGDRDLGYFGRLMRDIERVVKTAHERLVSPECVHLLEQAFLDRVDAARTSMIDSLARRRSHLGVETTPSRLIHDDWFFEERRRLDGIDAHISAHEHPFAVAPGYVLMTGEPGEHLLYARPLGWGRNPEGWHGRLVFDRYSTAETLAFELGLDASAVRQVRLQNGNMLLRGVDGYEWVSVDEERIVVRDMRSVSPAP